MSGVEGALELFHLVFFIVVFNAVIPGATIRWAVNRLRVERAGLPRPTPVLEITATEALPVRVLSFLIDPAAVVAGSRVADLPMPDGADILLLVRDGRILPVRDSTVLETGDHVHLLIAPEQIHSVGLLFGLREED